MNFLLNKMLLMLKSGYLLKKDSIKIYKFNNLCLNVLFFLYNEGYIFSYNYDDLSKSIIIILKYNNGIGAFHSLFLFSKLKKNIYLDFVSLVNYKSNIGMYVLSTSKGVLSIDKAIQNKIGGILLFFIF